MVPLTLVKRLHLSPALHHQILLNLMRALARAVRVRLYKQHLISLPFLKF